MLDAWIIEQIEKDRRESERTGIPLELPLVYEEPARPYEDVAPPDADRGVIVIDY